MIRLNLSTDPKSYDLGAGVTVVCLPLTSAIINTCIRMPGMPLLAKDDREAFDEAFNLEIAKRVIISWDGLGDADGNVIDPTPEHITALMNNWYLRNAFETLVVDPAMTLSAEKNASAPSSTGTSAGALTTAMDAENSATPAPT